MMVLDCIVDVFGRGAPRALPEHCHQDVDSAGCARHDTEKYFTPGEAEETRNKEERGIKECYRDRGGDGEHIQLPQHTAASNLRAG